MKKMNVFIIASIVIFLQTLTLKAQYIYKFNRIDDIYGTISSISRVDIFTCKEETVIDFYELGFDRVLGAEIDETETKLFFSHNLLFNYAMMDMNNQNEVVDLSRDVGSSGFPESGIDYKAAYHGSSETLMLYWRKWDPEIEKNTGLIDSCAIVDPKTGKNKKVFESFFNIYHVTFSKDGKKIFAPKTLSVNDQRARKMVRLVIDTETLEIINSFNRTDINHEASFNQTYYAVNNKLIVTSMYKKACSKAHYLFVYNMDTGKRSKRILLNTIGEYILSPDCKKIIINEINKDDFHEYVGKIHILDVEWPERDDDEIKQIQEGIMVQVPPITTRKKYKHDLLYTFQSNPNVMLYYYDGEPFENSTLIRISDGKILRRRK